MQTDHNALYLTQARDLVLHIAAAMVAASVRSGKNVQYCAGVCDLACGVVGALGFKAPRALADQQTWARVLGQGVGDAT